MKSYTEFVIFKLTSTTAPFTSTPHLVVTPPDPKYTYYASNQSVIALINSSRMVYLMSYKGPSSFFDIRSTSVLFDSSNPTSLANLNQVEFALNRPVFGGIELAKDGLVFFLSVF